VPDDHAGAPDCSWRDRPRPPGGGASFDLYDASKWGLNGLTQAWAAALRPHGVRVNNLCVGATDTDMLRSFLGRAPDPAVEAMWLRPPDVAEVVLELLGEGPTGRSGDNIGLWAGHPLALPPPGPTALS
jgi:NAD(P)-dependent dehydrogenase (short-subunit alcohol dehydrogenase family)